MARHEDRRHDAWFPSALAGGLIAGHQGSPAGRLPARIAALVRIAIVPALLLVALAPSPAPAKSPGDLSAADQYVETVPTSRGPSPTKDRAGGRTGLPEGVTARLASLGGEDAAALEAVATSDEFGAPQGTGGNADNREGKDGASSGSTPAVPSASVQAVSDSGGDLLWLLLALLGLTGLMVGAVAYQRHRNSKSG